MVEFTFQWYLLLTLLASTVFPLLVGLVTKVETDPGRKAVLLALLSVLTPVVTELAHALATGSSYDLGAALFTAISSFLIAVGLHFGLWKPTGVAQTAQSVGGGPLG